MKDDMKREVESLAKRYPKRGIDPTIPEGVRMQLMDMRRQEEQDKGMKAHEGRKLANGGEAKGVNMKKSKKFAGGGSMPIESSPPVPLPPLRESTFLMPTPRYAPPSYAIPPSHPTPPRQDEDLPPPRPVDESYYFKRRGMPGVGSKFGGNYTRSGRIDMQYAKGGGVKGYASGGKTGSASSRADGICQRGKTKGTMR